MPLTDRECKTAAVRDKDYKLADGHGLYLLVRTNGGKYWRWKYRYLQKEKLLALGVYPEVSLRDARERCIDERRQLAQGIDPSATRRAEKIASLQQNANTFEKIAWEWFEKKESGWAPATAKKSRWLLESHLIPQIGKSAVNAIAPPNLLAALEKIERTGALETAGRAKQLAGQIFRYAIATSRAVQDPSANLKGALKPPKTRHFPAPTTPQAFAPILAAIEGLQSNIIVKTAMKLAPMLFVRPGELRRMEWSELNLGEGLWELPAEKMKMRQPHLVPLSRQAIELLRQLEPVTGHGKYVFPGERKRTIPISENTLNACFRRLGYSKEQVTAHGLRSTARTILDEVLGFEPHVIEQQLAHEVKDPLGRAYNRTTHLPQRREMMQRWADYLDELKIMGE